MVIVTQQIDKILETNVKYEFPYWLETSNYQPGETVLSEMYNYMSVIPDNRGYKPEIDSGRWMVTGVDNVYACIDLNSDTSTVCNTDTAVDSNDLSLTMKISSTGFEFIGIGKIIARSVVVDEYDAGGALLKSTDYLLESVRTCSDSWYEYYFCPIPAQIIGVENILHPVLEDTIVVEITFLVGSAGFTAVGYIIGGNKEFIGNTLYPSSISLENASVVVRNHLGITVSVNKDLSEVLEADLEIDAKDTQKVKRKVRSHLNETVLLIGDPVDPLDSLYENMLILGKIRDFQIVMKNSQKSFGTHQ